MSLATLWTSFTIYWALFSRQTQQYTNKQQDAFLKDSFTMLQTSSYNLPQYFLSTPPQIYTIQSKFHLGRGSVRNELIRSGDIFTSGSNISTCRRQSSIPGRRHKSKCLKKLFHFNRCSVNNRRHISKPHHGAAPVQNPSSFRLCVTFRNMVFYAHVSH
jgi:hypothetical protein